MMQSLPPWKNPLREEIHSLFAGLELKRRPALRRSLLPDYLFATDLPRFAAQAQVAAFSARAESLGWELLLRSEWLNMRKCGLVLPENLLPSFPGSESDCLRILLRRHPGSADSDRAVFLLMKAREEGGPAMEAACRKLHREFAAALRRKEDLPSLGLD